MWSLDEKALYEDIDVNSGHVKGFDKEVLTNLIRFYLLKPTLSLNDIDNTEFLGPKKYLHNIGDKYNRNYAFKMHRHLYSNREPMNAKPDIEPWEKIVHIQFPSEGKILGKRENPWFLKYKTDPKGKFYWHPEFRTLDHYWPAYNPVKFRPKGKGDVDHKWVKKVFPPIPDPSQEK